MYSLINEKNRVILIKRRVILKFAQTKFAESCGHKGQYPLRKVSTGTVRQGYIFFCFQNIFLVHVKKYFLRTKENVPYRIRMYVCMP